MTQEFNNPALQQEPIGEPAAIIAPRQNESLFRWIKSTGRFMPSKTAGFTSDRATDELEEILEQDLELDEDE